MLIQTSLLWSSIDPDNFKEVRRLGRCNSQNSMILNHVVGGRCGGASEAPPPPLTFFVCHCQTAGDRELEVSGFEWTFIADIFFRPRAGQLTLHQKNSQPRNGYSSRRMSMKFTRLLSLISTYHIQVSEFSSW